MDNEELPYRSPVGVKRAELASTRDENDYSTLLEVEKEFKLALVGLYKDFDAFDLQKDAPKLELQVAARQEAYRILEPLQHRLEAALEDIKLKQEG